MIRYPIRLSAAGPLVSAKHEGLDRKHQRLDPEDHGMHEPDGIDRMENEAPRGAGVLRGDHIVVAGIGVGDAAAARQYAIKPTGVERLEKDENGSRPCYLLGVDQLLATAELAGGDEVLHVRDHHRDDGHGLRGARDLGRHSDLHDLGLNLPKARLQALLSGASRDQDPGRAHERVDDVTYPQGELLHLPADASPDDRLGQIRFGLGQRGFGARLFGWKEGGDLRLSTLSGRSGRSNRALAAFYGDLKLLDVPASHDAGVAPLQLLFGLQFINGLLVGALGLLDLAFRRHNVSARNHQRGVNLGNLATGGLSSCLLLLAIQPENRSAFLNPIIHSNVNLSNAPVDFWNNWDRSEVRDDIGRGWVIVENRRDQPYGEQQTKYDAPPQLEPDGEKRNLLTEPLALDIAPEEVVWKDGQKRTDEKLKHGSAPSYEAAVWSRAALRAAPDAV